MKSFLNSLQTCNTCCWLHLSGKMTAFRLSFQPCAARVWTLFQQYFIEIFSLTALTEQSLPGSMDGEERIKWGLRKWFKLYKTVNGFFQAGAGKIKISFKGITKMFPLVSRFTDTINWLLEKKSLQIDGQSIRTSIISCSHTKNHPRDLHSCGCRTLEQKSCVHELCR